MTDLTIAIDQYFPLTFEGFLFNEPDQVANQECPFHVFHLTDKKISFARFILFIQNGKGASPFRAPFGSVEFDPELKYEDLDTFINEILKFCSEKGLEQLLIVSYPFCYMSSNSQMLTYILMNKGFKMSASDLNFHITIHNRDFETILHESEKRRLKKCQKQNFKANVEQLPDIDEIFELVRLNRESKNYPISIKSEELKKLFVSYPGKYFAFTLRDNERLIACCIGVRVHSKILYYFLPADDPEYKSFSPMVRIIKEMFDFSVKNNYQMIDLGIATAGGIPNPGLIRFKQNLGAQSSLKLSFVKELK